MGEMVEFQSNGSTARGYLATPQQGVGPGVVVVQEWWGLVPQIKQVCDQLASEGFTALAPDLYHGELAAHDEMDKAAELMNSLPVERAARDMSGALHFLLDHEAVRGDGVGVVGYCMGGRLALVLANERPDQVKAVVSYYGVIPQPDDVDVSAVQAAVQGHFGTKDDFMPVAAAKEVEIRLEEAGADTEFHFYEAGHAFGNEADVFGTYDEEAAATAWNRTVEWLRSHLG